MLHVLHVLHVSPCASWSCFTPTCRFVACGRLQSLTISSFCEQRLPSTAWYFAAFRFLRVSLSVQIRTIVSCSAITRHHAAVAKTKLLYRNAYLKTIRDAGNDAAILQSLENGDADPLLECDHVSSLNTPLVMIVVSTDLHFHLHFRQCYLQAVSNNMKHVLEFLVSTCHVSPNCSTHSDTPLIAAGLP